jgi:diguanylate cyclase (GGDEF)-like protein
VATAMVNEVFYQNDRFTELKRNIYRTLLPLLTVAFILILYIISREETLNIVNTITFGTLSVGFTVAFLFLVFKKDSFRYVELAIGVIGTLIFLLRMYHTIIFELGKNGEIHLGTIAYWVSLLYILFFFTFRGKKALYVSFSIYFVTLIPAVYHVCFSTRVNYYTMDSLLQFFSANIGYIVALFYLQKVIESYLQIEVANHSANTDYLTNLPNRRRMDYLLHQEINRSMNGQTLLSICLIDVDHFKCINDTYGHEIGDSVLVQLSNLLKNHLGANDYFGRWGGEEFLIVLPNKNLKQGKLQSSMLKDVIANHTFKGIDKLTCSFGVTEYYHGDLARDILKRADNALYKAKETGRNQVIAQK